MDEIERYQRSLVSAARLQEGPAPAAFDRMRQRMLARIDSGDPGPRIEPPASAAHDDESQPSRRWIWWSLGAALATAALIALWSGPQGSTQMLVQAPDAAPMVGDPTEQQGAAQQRKPSRGRTTTRAAVAAPEIDPLPAAPTEAQAAEPVPVERVAPPEPRVRRKPTTSAPTASPSPPDRTAAITPAPASATSATDVAGEAALMQSVQRALAANDLPTARRQLSRYSKQFPNGVLAPEAAAVRIIVNCRRQTGGSSAAAAAYVKRHPSSPMAKRIRRECVSPSTP